MLVPSLMLNGEGATGTGIGSHPHGAGWAGRRQPAALVGLRRSFARRNSNGRLLPMVKRGNLAITVIRPSRRRWRRTMEAPMILSARSVL